MKTMRKIFTALLMVVSLAGMTAYSTSALAQGGTESSYGRIAVAIANCLELLATAKEGVEKGAEQASILKIMKAIRQESKEITGDNFGAELDFVNDELKRAYRSIKQGKDSHISIEYLEKSIEGFQILDKLKK